MCSSNSTTWSNHLQIICRKYSLLSPLSLLQSGTAWPKERWKCLVTVWYETELRRQAHCNSKMKYLNVQISGLCGQPHPALLNINITQDAKKLRHHLKFLTGDYMTNERLALDQPKLSPACKLCHAPLDTIEHVLVVCKATSEVRRRLMPDLFNTVSMVQPMSHLLLQNPTTSILTQFLLDCTSLNLPNSVRVPMHNPQISEIFRISRHWCYAISSERSRRLQLL